MTDVEVIGGGAVAQLVCRELLARDVSVRLYPPQGRRSNHQHHQLLTELNELPWLEGITLRAEASSSAPVSTEQVCLRIFAGTVEHWFDYQNSFEHQQARSPVLLLTSWWNSLTNLQNQLVGPVLPVFPQVVVESWHGRLAVLGQLRLELPAERLNSGLMSSTLHDQLNQFGLRWTERVMEHRFRALFSRTSFAYWYLVSSLVPKRLGLSGVNSESILCHWHHVQSLLKTEPDLQLALPILKITLEQMLNGDPDINDAAWILKILLTQKRRKIDYFLERCKFA